MISKSNLTLSGVYLVSARDFSIAAWNGIHFIGLAADYGYDGFFLRYESHWHDGPPYGTVKPQEWIGDLPPDITVSKNEALLDYLERVHKARKEAGQQMHVSYNGKEEA